MIMEALRKRGKFTPDFSSFRRNEKVLLFVYDEFVQGGLFAPILSDADYLGQGRTLTESYTMKIYMDSLAVVSLDQNVEGWRKGFIQGEVYAVTPDTLLDIDYHKRQGKIFKREERFINLLDQEPPFKHKDNLSVKCHIYFGVDEYWDVLDSKYQQAQFLTGRGVSKKLYTYTPDSIQKKIDEENRQKREDRYLYGDWAEMMY